MLEYLYSQNSMVPRIVITQNDKKTKLKAFLDLFSIFVNREYVGDKVFTTN
ncbi:conserved hypothetical protein [Thermoanaerobacter italicus Ab9]|uniref:Uncharacterized protein n=2 Tax=Thermoanaerobacter TaxID=1754 RepID=D3T8A4_THEIA|nr:hypothetical protein [Thermoanaerobacter italicus]ADD02186.1 conserved hypothetical protein [Thermoanaerobacter italicus Ab9]